MREADVEEGSKPTLKERQRALRQEAILDSAVQLISERGFATVTLEQIADAACVSKPTLYQHFRSKDDLVLHVSLRCLNLEMQRMLSVPAELPIAERLPAVLKVLADSAADPKVSLYIDLAQRVLPIRHAFPELAARTNDVMAILRGMIEEGQDAGAVRRDLSAQFLCQVLVSVLKDHVYRHEEATGQSPRDFADSLFGLLRAPGG